MQSKDLSAPCWHVATDQDSAGLYSVTQVGGASTYFIYDEFEGFNRGNFYYYNYFSQKTAMEKQISEVKSS